MIQSDWIYEEFKGVNLNDGRLDRRLIKLSKQFYSSPESTIPSACDGWTGANACYRFFQNPKVDHKKILEVHRDKSLPRSAETDRVLIVQDTTFIKLIVKPKD